MNNERKIPKDWTTWEDFANCYDLVLFNECVNLVHRDDKGNEEGVIYEWMESHTCDKESEDDDCQCETFQWYAIEVSEWTCEWLNKSFNLDIFYSDILGIHILPVYHYGTSWDNVSLSMNKDTL
jgi:hypothetical protein